MISGNTLMMDCNVLFDINIIRWWQWEDFFHDGFINQPQVLHRRLSWNTFWSRRPQYSTQQRWSILFIFLWLHDSSVPELIMVKQLLEFQALLVFGIEGCKRTWSWIGGQCFVVFWADWEADARFLAESWRTYGETEQVTIKSQNANMWML